MHKTSRLVASAFVFASAIVAPFSAHADPSTLTDGAPVGVFGTTPQGNADPTGAYIFEVPLDLPRGRGRVQPRVALRYSSAARGGNAGYGFRLAVPSIERAPLSGNPVIEPQGEDTPQLPYSKFRFERFTYGGQPLAYVCGGGPDAPPCASIEEGVSWPGHGSFRVYRQQVEDGTPTRLLYDPIASTWRVQMMGGLQLTFGGEGDAREHELHGSGVVRWHLTEEVDARNPDPLARDRAVYRWTKSVGHGRHAVLEHVYYTPLAVGTTSDGEWSFHIEMKWRANALRPTGYGSPLRTPADTLLEAIGVAAKPFATGDAREVKRVYRLEYTQERSPLGYLPGGGHAPLFHELFLRSVRQEGACGRTESSGRVPFEIGCAALPPITFQYEGGAIGPGGAGLSRLATGTFAEDRAVLSSLDGAALVDIDRDGLPDLVQSWASGPTCEVYNLNDDEWQETEGSVYLTADHALVCRGPGAQGSPPFANGRTLAGYLNEGTPSGHWQLRHQCMDAGDPAAADTLLGIAKRASDVPTTFLGRQAGATLLGSWGMSEVAWKDIHFRTMFASRRAGSSTDQGTCPLNQRTNSAPPSNPGWTWKRTRTDWAREAETISPEHGWYVDVDGDGLTDLLGRQAPTTSTTLTTASVRFTRRFARGERPDGSTPAQVPFVLDASGPPSLSVVSLAPSGQPRSFPFTPSRFFYADVNGDGLADFLTYNPMEDGGALTVRPGDGYGAFACNASRQPWPCAEGDLTSFYPLTFPESPRSPLPFDDETFLQDVTGDGLADVVKLVQGASGATQVWLWVNLDGKHFECAGFNQNGVPDCAIATLVDDIHVTLDLGPRRVTFADMDANGVTDIVVLTKSGIIVVNVMAVSNSGEIAHAPRPGLLTRIDNGRGATTRIRYRTIQDLDLAARSTQPWQHHTRAPGTVVTDITVEDARVDDSFQALPEPFGVQRGTSFEYREPAYDLWERRTLGFRWVRERHRGEDAVTETTYGFGQCQDDRFDAPMACPDGSSDDPDAWRTGRAERIDRLIPGIPGRVERRVLWSKALAWSDVRERPYEDHPSWFRPRVTAESTTHFDTSFGVAGPERGPYTQTGERTVTSQRAYDASGSLVQVHEAEVGVPERASVTVYAAASSTMPPSVSVPVAIPCDAEYVCRASHVTLWAAQAGGLVKHRETELVHGSWAGPTEVRAWIADGVALERNNPAGTGKSDGRPSDALGTAGFKTMSTLAYDAFGNVSQIIGAASPEGDPQSCTTIAYDPLYGQFATTILRFTNGCGSYALETNVAYDRATGTPVTQVDPNSATHVLFLDDHGRPGQVWSPSPDLPGPSVLAATTTYHDDGPIPSVEVQQHLTDGPELTRHVLMNGLGEPVMSLAGSSGYWLVESATPDEMGRPLTARAARSTNAAPATIISSALALQNVFAPLDRGASFVYDGFGRRTQTLEIASTGTTPVENLDYTGVFQITSRDAEQVRSGSPRVGGYTRAKLDHRGAVREIEKVRAGGQNVTEQFERLVTGEVTRHARLVYGGLVYERTAQYDSLGRMVRNVEPNVGEWRYTYTRDGKLLGTRDARGCGVDYYYDGVGRLLGEDASPCTSRQPAYTQADPATGEGFEVAYRYDWLEAGQEVSDATFTSYPHFATGSLTAVQDRGSHTRVLLDGRGRPRQIARRLATPPSSDGPTTYASDWFASRLDHDDADRLTRRTTGASTYEFLVNGQSEERWTYDRFSRPVTVGSSYGWLIRSIEWDPDGRPTGITYADGAATRTAFGYDARRRLSTLKTTRQANTRWSGPATADYPLPSADTTQTTIHDVSLLNYDAVGNPGRIRDLAGSISKRRTSAPQDRYFTYDDEYRVTSASYSYALISGASTFDTLFINPFSSEMTSGDRSPIPIRGAGARIASESFTYDGLGNVASSTDNRSLDWDRSTGAIVRGSAQDGPNQLRSANGVTAAYDEAGNLVELKVNRAGTCLGTTSRCRQWFAYDWDEFGRLLRARRWDFSGPLPVLPAPTSPSERSVPTDAPVRDLRFAYSLGERVIRWVRDEVGTERVTADVLPSLRLDRSAFEPSGNYDAGTKRQRPRLAGIFEARYESSLPSVDGNDLHLFLSLPDQLGSSTTVLEHASGEVAERVTYTAYGTTEQDFRPTRWGAHREPLRFTGKEDDIEIGLSYFGARYYAPNLRQWASADPLTIHAMGADPNPYAYVAGRVTTHVDPFGLDGMSKQEWAASCPKGVTCDNVDVPGTPRRDVQYNDRAGQAEHRTGMLQWARGAGAELVRWNNEWARNLNWVSLGVLESMPLSPIPGVPTISHVINAARIGQSPGANRARLVGQLIGLGATMAVGNELGALERSSATLATKAAEGAGGGGLGAFGRGGGGGGGLPTLTVDAASHPQLAENIANAQAAGHPSVLTYNGGGAAAAANRSAATAGIPKFPGTSIDEYPFASTMQGGQGAWVGHVPVGQQNAQGAMLRNFYGAEGIRPGDSFVVRVINFW